MFVKSLKYSLKPRYLFGWVQRTYFSTGIDHAKLLERPLFLDNQATTPIDPRVFDEMVPHMSRDFGNPHSTAHIYGTTQMQVCETAREQVAQSVNAQPEEIIFMSGATEANNTAIKGMARAVKLTASVQTENDIPNIITFATEHKCVLETISDLEKEGVKAIVLPVQQNGLIDVNHLKEIITDATILVSAMTVNNEIGVIQPIQQIGEICKEKNVLFHTDAAQAIGKTKIDVEAMNIDFLSLTGHKFYGPKGIGAMYINKRHQTVITPLMSGGGQEKGIRSGTLTPFMCAGLGKACELAVSEFENDTNWVTQLAKHFYVSLKLEVPDVQLNGDANQRYQGNVNVAIPGVPSARLIQECKQVSMSSGAACLNDDILQNYGGPQPSYVLTALKIPKDLALSSIRFSFGRFTTKEEVDAALEYLFKAIKKIKGE